MSATNISSIASRKPPNKSGKETARLFLALLMLAVPLLLGQQTTASVMQELGAAQDLPNVSGLEAPEEGENGPFRWSDELVAMQLQPLGYPLNVALYVQGVRPEGAPLAEIGASSGGKNLGAQQIPRSPSTVEYRLPLATMFSINPQITLTSTLFQPPGDRRHLGIVYYRLEERNGPGPNLPAPWPATALLLSGLLAYAATHNITRRTKPALIVAGIWGIGIGLLNAFERPWLVFYSWYFVVPPLVVMLLLPWIRGAWERRQHRQHPPSQEEVREQPALTANPWPIAIAVTVGALAIMAWHLLAPQEPPGFNPTHNISWGVSFYTKLPWPLQLLGAAIVIASLLWAWLAPVDADDQSIPYSVSRIPKPSDKSPRLRVSAFQSLRNPQSAIRNPRLWPWALAAVGMAIFALFPVAYSEGDSSEFDAKIPKGAIWRERELLDFYLKARLWRILEPVLRLPSQVYALVAVMAGGVYLWCATLVGRALGRDRLESLIVVGALCAIGNILLFFRYVESYALVTVASLFVLWACWRYTEGKTSFGTVGAFATLAPLFHGSALWWGPMVVAAWLLRASRHPRQARWRLALADLREGVFVGLAIVFIMGSVMLIDGYDYERLQVGLSEMGGADGRTLMPLFQTVTRFEHYAFFSWSHLGAVIQEQLLVAPMALLAIGIVAAGAWRGVRELVGSVPALIALTVGAASMFFYSISWNPDLGPRDDWDLLSLSALPLTMLAVFLLLRLPNGKPRRLALSAYLSVSAIHAAGWVVLHIMGITY